MKRLRELPSEDLEDVFFEMSIGSKSGCNVVVNNGIGDKYYNIHTDATGEYVVTEFKVDYEITKEEFSKFNKV
jgi:hypothetical protein